MLPASVLVFLALLQAPAALESPPRAIRCEEVKRLELSLVSTRHFEVCVSPGLMTGFRFDTPVTVDLQEDVRFEEVMSGRSSIGLVPPKDMAPGERIRLTAHLAGGESPQSVTFTLVAHRGRATHQVEVYRDKRTRESLLQEIEQERAKNQDLRAQLSQSSGLRGLFLAGALNHTGVPAQQFSAKMVREQRSDDGLWVLRGVTYRSDNSVGVKVDLMNTGAESWQAAGASLVGPTGETLEGVRIGLAEPISPQQMQPVFIEADAASGIPHGEVTLRLWGVDGRTTTLFKVTFPQSVLHQDEATRSRAVTPMECGRAAGRPPNPEATPRAHR
ncbi:MAG TPA: DUF2381 family protein [Archangium sp.]|uniref:DUF2381 family protein n=1 Tax=Archangium sp. TaxID=1872627 RepID=UPI002E3185B5|nr:DUF2381 family protein [Archangium sp.]HEX5753734.1 DUF2381 family protein [Archangium sp.]